MVTAFLATRSIATHSARVDPFPCTHSLAMPTLTGYSARAMLLTSLYTRSRKPGKLQLPPVRNIFLPRKRTLTPHAVVKVLIIRNYAVTRFKRSHQRGTIIDFLLSRNICFGNFCYLPKWGLLIPFIFLYIINYVFFAFYKDVFTCLITDVTPSSICINIGRCNRLISVGSKIRLKGLSPQRVRCESIRWE